MFTVQVEQEDDGRWIAEVPELAGVMAYGSSREEALATVNALASRVMADRVENGETFPNEAAILAERALKPGWVGTDADEAWKHLNELPDLDEEA